MEKRRIEMESNINKNHDELATIIGLDESFDVGYREFELQGVTARFYYVTGLCDTEFLMYLFGQLMTLNTLDTTSKISSKNAYETIKNNLIHQQVTDTSDLNQIGVDVLSGLLGIIIDGEQNGMIVDVRSYPNRSPEEPEVEKIVRGSKDGFTENIIHNTALVRRRIRDGRLRNEIFKVGEYSQTDVVLMYIDEIADKKLIESMRFKINQIDTDILSMSDRKIEEYLTKPGINPFPIVRYTERPDVLATHLYQGLVAIVTDTSPCAIILPCTYFDHLHNIEEYRMAPIVGTLTRITRTLGVFGSVFIVPLWYLVVMRPDILPPQLEYIGPNEVGNVPILIQIIIAEIGVDFLRMAAVHTPSSLSTAMGIVAGILVGQIAVEVGLFTPEVVLYVAVSAIGLYSTPSYELGLANKIFKYALLAVTAIFQLWGFIGGVLFYFLFLATRKSFGKPYLYPLLPLNLKDLWRVMFRPPFNKEKRYQKK